MVMPEYFTCFKLFFIAGDQTQSLAHPTLNTLSFSSQAYSL